MKYLWYKTNYLSSIVWIAGKCDFWVSKYHTMDKRVCRKNSITCYHVLPWSHELDHPAKPACDLASCLESCISTYFYHIHIWSQCVLQVSSTPKSLLVMQSFPTIVQSKITSCFYMLSQHISVQLYYFLIYIPWAINAVQYDYLVWLC